MSVGEIAVLINEIAGGKSEIVNLPMRPGENAGDRVTADNSTLGLVEMSPLDLVPLREGMEKTVAYFDEYLKETGQKE